MQQIEPIHSGSTWLAYLLLAAWQYTHGAVKETPQALYRVNFLNEEVARTHEMYWKVRIPFCSHKQSTRFDMRFIPRGGLTSHNVRSAHAR